MTIMSIAASVSLLIVIAFLYICFRKCKKVNACVMKIKRILIWNTFIRSGLETSIEILIAAFIRTYTINFEEASEALSSIYAIT